MHRVFAVLQAPVACLVVLSWFSVVMLPSGVCAGAAEGPPRLSVVVGQKAPPLERFAAKELATMLGRLFEAKAVMQAKPDDAAAAVILLGQPVSNPVLAGAVGKDWPQLSDQGLVLRRLENAKPTLIVGGGSAVATLWAVYELGERLGVRYLHDRDVYPQRKPFAALPEVDAVMEPNMRIRCWRLVNDLANGPISWSLAENRRFLQQMTKMKYNRIHVSLWPAQPFVHYTFRGMPKPPGVLFFGARYPIGEDIVGREKFAAVDFFTNPEFVGAEGPEEVTRRGVALVRGILCEARRLGMQTGLSIQPFEWPRQFISVLPGSEPARQSGNLTAGPGRNQSMDDPLLREMIATIVRAYIETYPEADYLHVSMPEWRHWIGQARESYERLSARYGQTDLGSFERLCARARSRTSFPGGGGRVEMMVKGDLVALDFFDSLLREEQLLKRAGGRGDIKLVYSGVVAELFPLVARMAPPGGEVRSFIDYTAARVLRQRDLLKQVPPKQVPASLILTLADDNIGVLPQLATGSLHTLMGELRTNGWAGFYTRYWTISEQDPAIHYLARASWDAAITPQQAYEDQVAHVCGPDAVRPALEALNAVEQATLNVIAGSFGTVGSSGTRKPTYQLYREALEKMIDARRRCRPNGAAYLDYFVGRMRFAVRYLDAQKAYGAAVSAEKTGKKQESLKHAEAAYRAISEALAASVEIARNHGDLGAVARIHVDSYRRILSKRNELRKSAMKESD